MSVPFMFFTFQTYIFFIGYFDKLENNLFVLFPTFSTHKEGDTFHHQIPFFLYETDLNVPHGKTLS